jgi:hypothetical protein
VITYQQYLINGGKNGTGHWEFFQGGAQREREKERGRSLIMKTWKEKMNRKKNEALNEWGDFEEQ